MPQTAPTPRLTRQDHELLARYHAAPRPMQQALQVLAHVSAGRAISAAMALHLQALEALVLADALHRRAA